MYTSKEVMIMVKITIDHSNRDPEYLERELKRKLHELIMQKQVLFQEVGFISRTEMKIKTIKDGNKILLDLTDNNMPCGCPDNVVEEEVVKHRCTACNKVWYTEFRDAGDDDDDDNVDGVAQPDANNSLEEVDREFFPL